MLRSSLLRRRAVLIHRCVVACAGLVIGGAYASGQTNLLLNPGFEAGVDGSPNASTGDVPMSDGGPWAGWNNWTPPYSGYYTTSITPYVSGDQVGKTFSGQNGGIYQTPAVTAGEAYTASAWFVNSSSDAMQADETDDVRITFFSGPNGSGNNLGLVISPTNVSMSNTKDTWTQLMVQAAAPAGAESVQWLAFFNNPLYNGGSLFVDDTSLLDTSWDGGGSDNNWSDNNNWGGVAPGNYAPLVFAGTTQLNTNNDFPAGNPFYGIAFQPSAGAFTLSGNQVNLASNVVNNSTNTQTIALALGLQQNTNFNTAAGNVNVSGAIGGAFSITKLGPFTLTLSGSNSYSGGTNVSAGTLVVAANGALPNAPLAITGGTLQLAAGTGASQVTSLSISGSGVLDITNNNLTINYGASPTPKATILSYLVTGANNGGWNGTGIVSSTAAGNSNYGVGYSDGADGIDPNITSGQLVVAYVQYGDITMQGLVNAADFHILASNFGQVTTSGWEAGDFLYAGVVNAQDFHLLAENFGQTASGEAVSMPASDWAALYAFEAANGITPASVPEPTGLLGLAAIGLLARRTQRHRWG